MTTKIRPRKNVYNISTSEDSDYESRTRNQEHSRDSYTKSTDNSSGEESRSKYLLDSSGESAETKSIPFRISYLIVILGIASFVWLYFDFKSLSGDTGKLNHKKDKAAELREELQEIRKKFPNQNVEMWESFSTITTIHPSVFLLLHREENPASDCLVQQVAHSAVKFLKGSSVEPIFIYGEEIKKSEIFINDYGVFLNDYQEDLERRNVMVIFNLQDFPPLVVPAFHSLCDPDNPSVKEAVYIFTLKVSVEYNHKPSTIAESVLKSLWNNSLSIDIMDPLIVRIANVVLFVKPEHDGVCS